MEGNNKQYFTLHIWRRNLLILLSVAGRSIDQKAVVRRPVLRCRVVGVLKELELLADRGLERGGVEAAVPER